MYALSTTRHDHPTRIFRHLKKVNVNSTQIDHAHVNVNELQLYSNSKYWMCPFSNISNYSSFNINFVFYVTASVIETCKKEKVKVMLYGYPEKSAHHFTDIYAL